MPNRVPLIFNERKWERAQHLHKSVQLFSVSHVMSVSRSAFCILTTDLLLMLWKNLNRNVITLRLKTGPHLLQSLQRLVGNGRKTWPQGLENLVAQVEELRRRCPWGVADVALEQGHTLDRIFSKTYRSKVTAPFKKLGASMEFNYSR